MRLTAFTDFALRALMRLAGEPERVFTTDEIAREFSISRNHLTKVVRELAEGGFVATHRGAGGGFRLARPAETITLGEVVRLLEARYPLVEWRLCVDAELSSQGKVGGSSQGIHCRARQDVPGRMRVSRSERAYAGPNPHQVHAARQAENEARGARFLMAGELQPNTWKDKGAET